MTEPHKNRPPGIVSGVNDAWDDGWRAGYDEADASTAKLMNQSRQLGYEQGFAAALKAMTGDEAVKAAVMNFFIIDWSRTEPRPEELTRTRDALTAAVQAVKQEAEDE